MSIRLALSHTAAGVFAVCCALAATGEARAQANVLKECGSQYQATKAANELKGQSWQDFLKACRLRLAEPAKTEAPAPTAAPAAEPAKAEPPKAEPAKAEPVKTEAPAANPLKPAPTAAAPAKPATGGQAAMRARQKACGAEWKTQKAELTKTDPKLKWPKFWSACNARLKAAGQ
jgi:hypothetical protein